MSHSSSQRSPSKTATALAVLAFCLVAASSTEIDQRSRVEYSFNRKGLRRKGNGAQKSAHDVLHLNNRRLVEYDGKIKLGPVHEEVDIYEKEQQPKDENNNEEPNANNSDQQPQQPNQQQAKPQEKKTGGHVEYDGKLVLGPAHEEVDIYETKQMQELQEEKEKLDNDLGQLQKLDDEDMKEERDQELEDEVTKLKSDLANLEALDGQLKEEMAEKDKPSKEEHIANLQKTEAAASNNPNQNLIDKDERTAIDLATALENSIAACDAAAAIQPPNGLTRPRPLRKLSWKSTTKRCAAYHHCMIRTVPPPRRGSGAICV